MTKHRAFLTLSLIALSASMAAPLQRDDLIKIPAGPCDYSRVLLREVLLAARKTATANNIHLRAEQEAILAGREHTVTLHAEGLTLDTLLEYATRTTGTEWKIENNQIVVFSSAKMKAAHRARLKSRTRQQLDRLIIPEISFDNIEIPEAFQQVRTAAAHVAGLGSVPKIDLPAKLSVRKTVRLKTRNMSVLALFDLLAAASVSTVDWRMAGSLIVLEDEAQLREADRLRKIARMEALRDRGRNRNDSGVDPFAPSGGISLARPLPAQPIIPRFHTESYDHFGDNSFYSPLDQARSTFSVDVDTASYANIRRMIREGARIPVDAARIEELINYFPYDYAPPAVGAAGEPVRSAPFAAHLEAASAPWAPDHRLVRIGLKGYDVDWNSRPPSNLVFLLDVSGSMESANKLPLVKESMQLLIKRLGAQDRISIVVYAGASGLVLPPTPGNKTGKIRQALDQLEAGGSTNAGSGITLAYQTARDQFLEGGNNRVILCTDGDFNVGTTDRGSLVSMVETEAKSGVFLTIVGFGMGNYKDGMLETLSNKGNGNYAYVDSRQEARKVFVHGLSGTLITIAKDVKVQVEFNPAKVGAYRLLGYENRLLNARDFDDDTKDAGEIGAGHTVTAFYEIVPKGKEQEILKAVSPLKYQKVKRTKLAPGTAAELLTLKLRYKEPDGQSSKLLEMPFTDAGAPFAKASTDFRFAASVAAFGMVLRDSDYRGEASLAMAMETARAALGDDQHGYRREFLELVRRIHDRE